MFVSQKANHTLGSIQRSVQSRVKERILPSVFMRAEE